MLLMTRKRSRLLWKMLCIDFNTPIYLSPVEVLQEFENLHRTFYACAASVAYTDTTSLTAKYFSHFSKRKLWLSRANQSPRDFVGFPIYDQTAYNACQKSWNTDINFQGQNQSSPSPPRNNVGLLSNGLGF